MNKLVLFACAALLLASCSQRYGYIPKVRANQKHQAAVASPAKKKKLPELNAIPAKPAEQSVVVLPEAEIDRTVAAASAQEQLPVMKKQVRAKNVLTSILHKNKAPEKESIQEFRAKKQTISSQEDTKIQKGSWLWYVIVGLIIVLIGGLLWGLAGQIITLVGVIVIIYGLLVLLEVM